MNPSLLIQFKRKKKAQTQLSSASRYRQTPTAQMNNFVYASLYYKKIIVLLYPFRKKEVLRHTGYNNRS